MQKIDVSSRMIQFGGNGFQILKIFDEHFHEHTFKQPCERIGRPDSSVNDDLTAVP